MDKKCVCSSQPKVQENLWGGKKKADTGLGFSGSSKFLPNLQTVETQKSQNFRFLAHCLEIFS